MNIETQYHGGSRMEIKLHKSENPLFIAKTVLSVCVLCLLVLGISDLEAGSSFITTLTMLGVYVVFIWLFIMFQKIYLVGYLKGNGIPVTERQFPEIFEVYKKTSEELGIKKLPPLFVLQQGGALNAFAIRFSCKNYIAVYSDIFSLVDTDAEALKFVLAHELGHVKRHHMSKRFWTFLSSLVPFLTAAYSRSCEYTCDNIGKALSPEGSLNGLLILAAGKDLYKRIDRAAYVEDAKEQNTASAKFIGLCMGHPFLPKRIRNLERQE